MIEQGAVKIDEQKVSDPNAIIPRPSAPLVAQAGKRTFFRLQ